ncbi:MAG: thioredoxin family protein [Haloferacaceae archaeon]
MTLTDSDSELALGDAAPEFSLPGTDGATHSLADYADYDALLVVFTCNHCPYAKAKFDELNHLAETYDDLAVVGINPNDDSRRPDDSFDRMVEYVESGTVDYDAYLRDESQDVARAYGAVCTPDPFLFAREEGAFRLAYHGRIDDAMSPDDDPERFHMREAVEAVLAGEAVPFADENLPSRGCDIKWRT